MRLLLMLVAMTAAVSLLVLLLFRPPVVAPVQPGATDPLATERADRDPEVDRRAWVTAEWQAIEDPFGPERSPPLRVDGLADGGELLVGWGRTPVPGRNQFSDMGAVFISRDGRSWEAIPIDHGVNPASTSELVGVAYGPRGYLAYGGVCCEPESRAVWHSTDGVTWMRLEIGGDFQPADVYFGSVVGIDEGWVAIGNTVDGATGGIWISPDGASWESVLRVEGGPVGEVLSDLAATPSGLVVVGTLTGPDGTYDGAIWASADGRSWQRLGADDPALTGAGESQLHTVVAFAGGDMFVTGTHGSSEERERCDQLGMVVASLAPPSARTALTCVSGTEYHWASSDGQRWERVDPAAHAGQHPIEFRHVVPGGPGLVVLGESSGPASPDTNLFTSPDGVRWTAVGPREPIGNGVATGLVVRDREVMAVAEHFAGGLRSEFVVWLAHRRRS